MKSEIKGGNNFMHWIYGVGYEKDIDDICGRDMAYSRHCTKVIPFKRKLIGKERKYIFQKIDWQITYKDGKWSIYTGYERMLSTVAIG